MEDEIRLTKAIHHFVRGQLSWNYSIHLLEEIIESDEWLQFLEMDMMLFEMGLDAARREEYRKTWCWQIQCIHFIEWLIRNLTSYYDRSEAPASGATSQPEFLEELTTGR